MEPQHSTALSIIGVVIAILILGGGAWLFLAKSAIPTGEGLATTTPAATTIHSENGVSGTGNFSVSKDDTVELPTPPDFRAAIAFAPSTAPEVKTAIAARAKLLEDKLAKNTFDLEAWIDLGAIRKMAGDYRGAETAWVFVTKAAPRHPMAYANLADLYMNFLKDYPKADTMYQKVAVLQPDSIDPYISLAIMYENFYKAGGTPDAILKKGIAANPKSLELELALARYYARVNRAPEAKTAYQAAIEAAKAAGHADTAAQIQAEAGL